MSRERRRAEMFSGLGIDRDQRLFRFAAYISALAVGRKRNAMRHLDIRHPHHDLVRRRIDDVDIVAGAVSLPDADGARKKRKGEKEKSGPGHASLLLEDDTANRCGA